MCPRSVEQLELPYSWGGGSRDNVEAHVLCTCAREEINLLVTNRRSRMECLPFAAIYDLDCVGLHLLSIHEPFHGQSTIETNGMGERQVDRCRMRSLRR